MTEHSATKVAFIGLGLMGAGMADNLIKAGFSLALYNRNPVRAAAFSGRARVTASPRDAAQDADVVIAMVADDAASREVWLGEQGAMAGLKAGALCIECSTLTPAWIAEWAGAAAARGGMALDAPVTGSRTQAEGGQLNFMVGASEQALERAWPVLSAMGRKIVSLGPVGSGATFKLINNFLCGTQLAALAEAMAWVDRSGLDRQQVFDTLVEGAPGSPFVRNIGTRMVEDDPSMFFLLRLMAKDLAYAAEQASRSDMPLTTAATARALIEKAVEAGFGDKDMSALYAFTRTQHV